MDSVEEEMLKIIVGLKVDYVVMINPRINQMATISLD